MLLRNIPPPSLTFSMILTLCWLYMMIQKPNPLFMKHTDSLLQIHLLIEIFSILFQASKSVFFYDSTMSHFLILPESYSSQLPTHNDLRNFSSFQLMFQNLIDCHRYLSDLTLLLSNIMTIHSLL